MKTRFTSLEINPMIVKELRSRMRGGRAFLIITLSLALMGIVSYGLYRITIVSQQYSSSPISPQVGQMLFAGLVFLQLGVIAIVTPAITAGEISGEREKQTYEMLMTTPLSPARILWGKLFASISFILLVILAAIPMASLVFIFGGVALRDMLKALLTLIIIAVFFGVIGLFFSALFKRTGTATIASYFTIGLLFLWPLFAGLAYSSLHQTDPPRYLLAPSPITVLGSTFSSSTSTQLISSTFWMISSPVYWLLGGAPLSATSIPRPIYHYSLPLYILATLVLYLITTRLIKPLHRWRISWSEVLIALVLVLGFLGLSAVAYLATTNRYENIQMVAPETPTPEALPIPGQKPPGSNLENPLPTLEEQLPAPEGWISEETTVL